jgi:alpha-beta hydrolase superfamily lysophospholipase
LAESTHSIETFAANDGYALKYRRYVPTSAPRARVVCVHGIQSHAGWYAHSCTRLQASRFEVFYADRRGSGMNPRDSGDTPSFRRLLDDVAEFVMHLRKAESIPPSGQRVRTFLIAVSWGGKLAVALQRRHPGLADGIVLLCPGFFPIIGPTFRERVAMLLARITNPRRLFPVPLNDPELFTGSSHRQLFIRNDPFSLRQATARFFVESARLDAYLRFVSKYVTVPTLLMLAEKDRIIDNARTRRFVERFATGDKVIFEYPGAHHTLEFEPEPERFIGDLISWLERHIV